MDMENFVHASFIGNTKRKLKNIFSSRGLVGAGRGGTQEENFENIVVTSKDIITVDQVSPHELLMLYYVNTLSLMFSETKTFVQQGAESFEEQVSAYHEGGGVLLSAIKLIVTDWPLLCSPMFQIGPL